MQPLSFLARPGGQWSRVLSCMVGAGVRVAGVGLPPSTLMLVVLLADDPEVEPELDPEDMPPPMLDRPALPLPPTSWPERVVLPDNAASPPVVALVELEPLVPEVLGLLGRLGVLGPTDRLPLVPAEAPDWELSELLLPDVDDWA
jgi:hypothetical protein